MSRIILRSNVAVVLAIMLVLTGCGGSESVVDKNAGIVSEVFGDNTQTFQIVSVDGNAGGQATAHPLVNRITDPEGVLLGYTVRMQVKSRSGPFAILVVIGGDLCVKRAEVLTYRAKRGREVRSPEFTSQFAGKCPGDPIRLDHDIHSVTGATLSAKAMTDGVRNALQLVTQNVK